MFYKHLLLIINREVDWEVLSVNIVIEPVAVDVFFFWGGGVPSFSSNSIIFKFLVLVHQWRIIACESSDYRHMVHDDGFVWLMFVHERFSTSEQTLNSQNHGVHYMSVITRLTCNNSILLTRILLTRNSPDWQTYRDDTADDTVLCISGIVLGMTGLRLWLACVHKGNIRTS